MSLPNVVSREEWTAARKALLEREKEATRARDALNAERRRLPMVAIDQQYVFEGAGGKLWLAELFEGRRQLVLYHFMFAPEWENGCTSCSGFADQIGHLAHLNARETTFACVSRAPYPKIAAFQERMGWSFPWYSAYGSDFCYDFHVTLDDSVAPVEYNYRSAADFESAGISFYMPGQEPLDLPGISCFLHEGDRVFHTYSAYARGVDGIGFTTALLDLTALGRQEEWEEPRGRAAGGAAAGSPEIRYHDEYDVI